MTAEPPAPFPTSPYCRVRARVASIWADGTDDGTHPDWRPAVGEKVTLTPSIGSQLLVYDAAGPNPIIVTVERVECVVDDDGWLAKPDGRHVYIAPTDDPLLSARGWPWTATIKGKSISFSAPSGGVVDLALFVATPAVDATEYVSVVQIVADYIAANPPDVEQAVADYLTANPPAAAPDATTTTKGLMRLAGDLAGTADAPTVPGLADKADASHTHTMADLTDYTPPDPGGLKVYASWAEVDAETESTMGVLTTDDWAPAGLTHDGTHDAAFFITTHVQTIAAGDDAEVWRHQYLRMWDGVGYAPIWMSRDFSYGGPWSSWGDVTYWELPPALRGSLAKAEDAVVQLYDNAGFNNPKASYVVGHLNANWRTLTGFAELPDTSADALVSRGGSLGRSGNWAQTVVVPVAGGTRTITRVSTDGTSYGAWTLQPTIPTAPGDIGAAPVSHEHTAADIDSGAAVDGHILTANGAGGAVWEAPPEGGGGGGSDPWTYYVVTGDVGNDTTTYATITGLSVPAGLAAGQYEVRVMLTGTPASGGYAVGVDRPDNSRSDGYQYITISGANIGRKWIAGGGPGITADSAFSSTFAAAYQVPLYEASFILTVTATTTSALSIAHRAVTDGANTVIKAGSFLAIRRISA